ncbi:MAG: amidase [Gammaproteobacteria bacterium]|nr:amidase [Gammaproteobacteria bacterium]
MSDADVAYLPAYRLRERLRTGQLSSLEATDLFIARIEARDADINAVVVRDFDRARDDARKRDRRLARGHDVGSLHGLPMTIKEQYHRAGLPTTFGYPELADNVPTWDSDLTVALRAAGAVIIGKTNVPLGGADFQTYNDLYGTTNNPWDLARTPGGSSGGSAAALAAGFAPLEAGSDIAGSIRNPAHFCGVYGHKPTWGIVSQRGHTPVLKHPTPDLDLVVCGPLARTPEDLALALRVVAGRSIWNSGWRLDLPAPTKTRLSEFRVAVWPNDDIAPVDDEIADRVRMVAQVLRDAGATVSEVARPDIDPRYSHETYRNLSYSVVFASVPPEEYERNRRDAERYAPDDRSDRAVSARSMVLSHADWLRADARRTRLRLRWAEFFRDWDILICPQMAAPAFEHDHTVPIEERTVLVNGEPQEYWKQAFWSGLVTAPYLPSTVFPTGLCRQGLPIGLQAVGGAYQDYRTIDFTRLLAEEIGGFRRPPVD